MKEDFLHYLWKYQLFDISNLQSTQNEKISVIKPGVYNTDAGPDFLYAQIRIGSQLWVGNVEIHINSSDWYAHTHEEDENYKTTILHVVWNHDMEVFVSSNDPIPTLELKKRTNPELIEKYNKLTNEDNRWIPCEKQLASVDQFTKVNFLEGLFVERLERKSVLIEQLLEETKNDWEAVLFILLSKSFGLNKNAEAFYQMALRIPFSVLRKVRVNHTDLTALLFGQAGFLEDEFEESYFLRLKESYAYMKKKFKLKEMDKNTFQFFRMRPHNFPTIRIAQIASLYHRNENLFGKLMKVNYLKDYYHLFEVEVDEFWKKHYTFHKASKKTQKRLTHSFINLLLINTIVPLKFAYQKRLGNFDEDSLFQIVEEIPAEQNRIVTKYSEIGFASENALSSQALLTLKNDYCAKKRCLQCAIGNQLLRN